MPLREPDNVRGLLLMGLGMFLFSAVDAQAKYLTQTLHPLQIVWVRQLGLLVGALILLSWQGPALFRTGQPVLQVLRGLFAACSATLFIVAVRYVPLADAVAVAFVAPFIVTVLAAVILREHVGIRRWAAVIIGFLGTLVVIRPGMGVIHPAAFLVVLAAVFFALRQIISRALSATDNTFTTVAYTAVVGSTVLTIPLAFVWQWPATTVEVTVLITMAILAGVAEVCVIKALEIALAVVVAPVQYTLMIWGTIYGYLVFGQFPDFWTWVGATIIIATGFYTIHRERVIAAKGLKGRNA